ncbi:MAG: fibronectin type III domain-containing protein [Spirochaetes bacterium]|nr:fibronectin type III domain-containing protein [Spirochaetota bacterium]
MKKILFILTLAACLIAPALARAAIESVTLTPAPTTTLSNGRPYYCAGVSYTFRIQARDPAATGKGYWSNAADHTIEVSFPGGSSFYVDLNSPGADAFGGTNITVDSATDNSGGVYTVIDYTVVVRFNWNAGPVAAVSNSIVATVTANNGATTDNATRTFIFGVISQIAVINFAQTADAADGYVNPWHDTFDLTGRIAYYIAGQNISTLVPLAEISSITLYRNPATPAGAAVVNSGTNNDFQYAVPAEYFSFGQPTAATVVTGAYTWSITATMATGGASEPSSSGTLGLTVGMVSVAAAGGITFVNGGGVNAPYYVRSVNVAGTRLSLATPAAMVGTVNFSVDDDLGNSYAVQVNNGATSGAVDLGVTPTAVQVPDATNVNVTYEVQSVTGGAYGNTNPANGQNVPARILNSGGHACRWENNHPPGDQGAPFTTGGGVVATTAISFTLEWDPLTTAGPNYDADFDTYRVYFRRTGDPSWEMLDRSTHAALGNIGVVGTPVSFTVGGVGQELEPLTQYEYQISALDVFGNDVLLGNRIVGTVTTNAEQVTASISDGISSYNNDHFNDTNPESRPVRKSAITVTVKIYTAGSIPDSVRIIVANNDSDLGPGPPQYGMTSTQDSILNLPADQRWSISCARKGANTYEGFIPSEHPLMQIGTNIRFIVETWEGGTATWNDHTPDPAPPGDWWSDEWRFRVAKKALFIPWPTRVLNNVLTNRLPCCFPAYFLVADALVTIKVYDVKGRVIATLAEKMYRPGGQNIKEMGWCGLNKDNRRVGPGLYYIHIKAVTIGNRTILDKMMKVVVAR